MAVQGSARVTGCQIWLLAELNAPPAAVKGFVLSAWGS